MATSICLNNVRGLRNKFDEFKQLLSDYDIFAINETKLSPTYKLPNVNKYSVFRHDRTTGNISSGGVALFVKTELMPSAVTLNQSNQNYEAVGVELTLHCGSAVCVVSVYFPPGIPVDANMLSDLETRYENLVVLGDFNAKSPVWGLVTAENQSGQIGTFSIKAIL